MTSHQHYWFVSCQKDTEAKPHLKIYVTKYVSYRLRPNRPEPGPNPLHKEAACNRETRSRARQSVEVTSALSRSNKLTFYLFFCVDTSRSGLHRDVSLQCFPHVQGFQHRHPTVLQTSDDRTREALVFMDHFRQHF